VVRRPGWLLAAVARTAKEFPAPAGVSSTTRTDFRLLPSYGRSGRLLSGLSSQPPFGSRSSVPGFLLRCPVRGERNHTEETQRRLGSRLVALGKSEIFVLGRRRGRPPCTRARSLRAEPANGHIRMFEERPGVDASPTRSIADLPPRPRRIRLAQAPRLAPLARIRQRLADRIRHIGTDPASRRQLAARREQAIIPPPRHFACHQEDWPAPSSDADALAARRA
jgi:hypothetical protein